MLQPIQCAAEIHRNGQTTGSFILMDTLAAAQQLLSQYHEQIQLIYLDPPFTTGKTFNILIPSEDHNLVYPVYHDNLSEQGYLDFMRKLLAMCRELLTPQGSLYLHVDFRKSAQMKLLLDELFGAKNFMNEIIWTYRSGGRSSRRYSYKHDNILLYRKSAKVYFDIASVSPPRGTQQRNHMKRITDASGQVSFTIKSNGRIYTYTEDMPLYLSDVWDDIGFLHQKDPERTGYPTQKPEALLKRIITASSSENDIILDLFSGSGTTAVTAAELFRRWIAVDASPYAMHILRKRLLEYSSKFPLLSPQNTFTFYNDGKENQFVPSCSVECYNNGVKITLNGYNAPPSQGAESIQLIDYWAIGEYNNGSFICLDQAFRSRQNNNTLKRTLAAQTLPKQLAVHVADVLGNNGFYIILNNEMQSGGNNG